MTVPTGSPNDRRGLRNRLNRILRFDVNVTDRERSARWYEATTPLRVVGETHADQAFPSLGLVRGRFEGYVLRDVAQSGQFPAIHLVQWLDPVPVGEPYASHAQVGWYRIVPQVADIEAAYAAVVNAGSEPFARPTDRDEQFHAGVPPIRYQVFAVHDPDGITVEFAQEDGPARRTPIVVAHNTADVRRSLPFYTDTLGLDFMQGLQTAGPMPNVYSPGGGTTQHDGALLGLRGDTRVMFDWLEWSPAAPGGPYPEPHHVGIVRCALEVDDLAAAHRTLLASGWATDGEIFVSQPETWDLGGPLGTAPVVELTDPEGVRFQLVEQVPYPNATLDGFGLRDGS